MEHDDHIDELDEQTEPPRPHGDKLDRTPRARGSGSESAKPEDTPATRRGDIGTGDMDNPEMNPPDE